MFLVPHSFKLYVSYLIFYRFHALDMILSVILTVDARGNFSTPTLRVD